MRGKNGFTAFPTSYSGQTSVKQNKIKIMKQLLLIVLSILLTANLYSQQCFDANKEGMGGYSISLTFTTGNFDFEAPEIFKGTSEFDGGFDEIEITTLTEKKRTVLETAEIPEGEDVIEIVFDESYEGEIRTEVKFTFTVSSMNGIILFIEKKDDYYGKISFSSAECPD